MSYDNQAMTSTKPYLVRAFYEWIVDNKMTPYLVLNATLTGVQVPKQYVENGRIVLNISPNATDGLMLTNAKVEFKASFGPAVHHIRAPIYAVEAIYARETGKGMIFSEEENMLPPEEIEDMADDDLPPDGGAQGGGSKDKSKRAHLKVVK